MKKQGNDDWRAPRRTDWRKAVLPITGLIAVALAAALGYMLFKPPPPPPPAPPPPPTAHALTALETTGFQALLDRQKTGAHKMSGYVTDAGGRRFGVQLSATADNAVGVGVVTAGGTRGDALLDQGVVFLRGDQDFWSAMGVTGPAPAPPGWVNIGPNFLDGKLFMAPAKWTGILAPTPAASIDGDRYTLGDNSAVIGATDITHVTVAGIDVDIAPVAPQSVTDAAAPLIAGRGDAITLGRTNNGGWLLPVPAPAADEAPTTGPR